jgi:hypothetical protein
MDMRCHKLGADKILLVGMMDASGFHKEGFCGRQKAALIKHSGPAFNPAGDASLLEPLDVGSPADDPRLSPQHKRRVIAPLCPFACRRLLTGSSPAAPLAFPACMHTKDKSPRAESWIQMQGGKVVY